MGIRVRQRGKPGLELGGGQVYAAVQHSAAEGGVGVEVARLRLLVVAGWFGSEEEREEASGRDGDGRHVGLMRCLPQALGELLRQMLELGVGALVEQSQRGKAGGGG